MPIYEYNCLDCQEQVSLLFRSFAEVETRPAVCPHCGGSHLERVVSKVAVVHTSGGGQVGSGSSNSGATDQSDPKALAHSMQEASRGKDFGSEFKEVATRLESGEKPAAIEKSLRRRVGQNTQAH
jgi:putative FmdB family regulatory protein